MVPPVVDFSAKSIDQLLNDLDVLRAKKGEMDTLETKLVAVLRLKLAEQEQRLRKYGLVPGDTPSCCAAPSALRSGGMSGVPTASR
jgi:hypothetical protein